MRGMKVLVVGGAGYVGGYLVDHLQSEYGVDVTVYDCLAYEDRYLKDIKFIYGDVRDRAKLREHLPNYDVVVWLAAIVGDGACAADVFMTQTINEDCVKWLVDTYKGKIVFTSTCSVYGANQDLLYEDSDTNPLSVYATTKLAAEQYILQHASDRSLVFRLGTLHGLGDVHSRIRLDLVVNVLAARAAQDKPLTVFGGQQWRPLLHVRDVATAVGAGLQNEVTGLYNLAQGNWTILEIAEQIHKHTGCDIEVTDMQFEDQRNYKVDFQKFVSASSWEAVWSLDEGIQQIFSVVARNRIKNPFNPLYSNQAYIEAHHHSWL